MKTYTIIGGIDGVGKTSLLGFLQAERNDLGVIIHENRYPLESDNIYEEIHDCLQKKINFTQKSTLTDLKVVKTAQAACAKGYRIRMYYIGIDSVDECLKRVQNRVSRGGQNISCEKIIDNFERRFNLLTDILSYCDEASFFDNDNGFREVAKYTNGQFILTKNIVPFWLTELIQI